MILMTFIIVLPVFCICIIVHLYLEFQFDIFKRLVELTYQLIVGSFFMIRVNDFS